MYPYGLNERYSREGDSKYLPNVFNTFNKLSRGKRGKVQHVGFRYLEFDLPGDKLVELLLEIFRDDKFWPYHMHKLLLAANYRQRTRFHHYLKSCKHPTLSKTLHAFLLDLTDAHQVTIPKRNIKRRTPSLFMKILFHNQSIEDINLETILSRRISRKLSLLPSNRKTLLSSITT